MTTAELTQHLKAEALRLGFDRVGIAPAVSPPGHAHLVNWLKAGHGAGMTYMQRHVEIRRHPDALLEGVRSVVMVSLVYGEHVPESSSPVHGKIARYARGLDYHRILWDKLEELLAWLRQQCPGIHGRALADTAPLMERDFARLAGMGWIGKNTMLINRAMGSFTVLGALLVDRDLVADDPHVADHCGTCTRCLDACPTDAFVSAYQLDARRCISYWTIEHKGPIAEQFAGELHGWVFGCDVCQDVCPWNRKAPAGRLVELHGTAGMVGSRPHRMAGPRRKRVANRAARDCACCGPRGSVSCAMRRWCWDSGRSRRPCRLWLEDSLTPVKTR